MHGGLRKENPFTAVVERGFLSVFLCCFWLLFAAVTESNPYKDLLLSLDKGFEEALTVYTKGNAELPFDDQYELQEYISSILPIYPNWYQPCG